jgi:hypothetical protein
LYTILRTIFFTWSLIDGYEFTVEVTSAGMFRRHAYRNFISNSGSSRWVRTPHY